MNPAENNTHSYLLPSYCPFAEDDERPVEGRHDEEAHVISAEGPGSRYGDAGPHCNEATDSLPVAQPDPLDQGREDNELPHGYH